MEDRDLVRVDLLKFRRKAFLSYPPGSEERKTFLKVILQNELYATKNEAPQDAINLLIASSGMVLKDTVGECILLLMASIFSTLTAIKTWHQLRVTAIMFSVVSVIALVKCGFVLTEYYKYWKSIKVIKEYSNDIKKHMNHISNEIKRLEGPHGF